MKSEFFFCPHCNRKCTKSAAAFVLGETGGSAAGMGISQVTCPACGRAIDAQAMIDGKYDNAGGAEGVIFLLAWVGGTFVLQASEYTFWPALGLGFLIGLGAAVAWGVVAWLFEKLRR